MAHFERILFQKCRENESAFPLSVMYVPCAEKGFIPVTKTIINFRSNEMFFFSFFYVTSLYGVLRPRFLKNENQCVTFTFALKKNDSSMRSEFIVFIYL